MELKLLNSLEKVFPDSTDDFPQALGGNALMGERHSFVIALKCHQPNWGRLRLSLSVTAEPTVTMSVKRVELVPCEMPCYEVSDGRYLRTAPGMYPDVLAELPAELSVIPNRWQSFWVQLNTDGNAAAGQYRIAVSAAIGEESAEACYTFEVLPVPLPEQKLLCTQWFHADCIADYHRVDIFSEEHWALIEQYIKKAAEYGINTILTPLLTPPLDTAVGCYRPTVQLVKIDRTKDSYSFDFSLLTRWMDICDRNGIRCFEMNHMFTQWGAEHTPKVMATVDGEEKMIFGWDTDSKDPTYRRFLMELMGALRRFLKERGAEKRCYFHVSDEPQPNHLERYRYAVETLRDALGGDEEGFTIIDALSDIPYYENGLVREPVVAINHIRPFLDAGVENLWAYYCCSQHHMVSNRFIAMPSYRNRIMGIQMYYHHIKGFLQWGFNFYNTRLSKKHIDPYAVTDAGGEFPSGDAFSVYPTEGGCTESLRLVVFHEALQDMRALNLLESLIGRAEVDALIRRYFGDKFSFEEYPIGADAILNFRAQVNRLILSNSVHGESAITEMINS